MGEERELKRQGEQPDAAGIIKKLYMLRTTEEIRVYKKKLEIYRGIMPADEYCFMKGAVEDYERRRSREEEKRAETWSCGEDVKRTREKLAGDTLVRAGGHIFSFRREECAALADFILSAAGEAWEGSKALLKEERLTAALCGEGLFAEEHFCYLIRLQEAAGAVCRYYAKRRTLGAGLRGSLKTMGPEEINELGTALKRDGQQLAYWEVKLLRLRLRSGLGGLL